MLQLFSPKWFVHICRYRLKLLLICVLSVSACAESNKIKYKRNYSPASAKVEIRLASFESNASMRIASWRKQNEEAEKVFVSDDSIISTLDILGTSLTESESECGNGVGVFIFLRPKAVSRFGEFSEMHIGDHVALLINNEVGSIIQIRSTLVSSPVLICNTFSSSDQAEIFAKLISDQ